MLNTFQTDSFEVVRMIGVRGWQTFPGNMKLKRAKKHFNRMMKRGLLPNCPHAHLRVDVIKENRLRPVYHYTITDQKRY